MRAGLPLAGLILMLPTLVWGTTLRLSADVDLLVLDGKRVSSSLLKGADSIEIDNGPHQLVLRVEKKINNARSRSSGVSPPTVISFDTKEIDQVNIVLPLKDPNHSGAAFQIKLQDGQGHSIPIRTDILEIKPDPTGTDYEEETQRYNKSEKKASMPGFANRMANEGILHFAQANPDLPPAQSEVLTEQRLRYWFSQADNPTRARFLRWANETHNP
ncbi:curli synthesis inhibitor [Enterobacter sp. TMH.L2]